MSAMTVEYPHGTQTLNAGCHVLRIAEKMAERDQASLPAVLVATFNKHFDTDGFFVTALGKACHPSGGASSADVATFRRYMWAAYAEVRFTAQ